MTRHESGDVRHTWRWHRWINHLQTLLLVLTLSVLALLLDPAAASALTLRLYGARPIHPSEAPAVWATVQALARRAELPAIPIPHYVPSAVVNAFATGSRQHSAIALTDGLLRRLTPRELEGVIAHEMAHIANDDLRVMGLADYISRLTHFLATMGQVAIVLSLPALIGGHVQINLPGLFLLAASPQLALLAQLRLSRVREFDADRLAAQLTGDPHGLASALAKIEQVSRSWRAWLMPGWGDPESSWLRAHPATAQRIERLLALAPQSSMARQLPSTPFLPQSVEFTRPPRWRSGGLWR